MKNLNTAFPFYDSLWEQIRYKDNVDREAVPFIICRPTALVPFIIRRLHSAGEPEDLTMYVVPCNGGNTLTFAYDDVGLQIQYGTTYDYIYYTGRSLEFNIEQISGGYYLAIYDAYSSKYWYSETFNTYPDVSAYLLLEYVNVKQIGNIMAGFQQSVYIDETYTANLFRAPEYPREDIGDKRDGIIVLEKQILQRQQVLRWKLAPGYLVDALMLVPLMDQVTMTYDEVQYEYLFINCKDPEWKDYGHFAQLEMNFVSEIIVKKLNFREIGYTGEDMATIKQGYNPTLNIGGEWVMEITFDTPMPSLFYTVNASAYSDESPSDPQLPIVTSQTVAGFTLKTVVKCNVFWTAILVQ